MNTAFIFPGQGAQAVGMGACIAKEFPQAARIYSDANEILGFDLKTLCFDGPEEKLNTTAISQPAIFVTSAAILEVLRSQTPDGWIKPDVAAGLSLGEYTALYAAGVISFEAGLKLVAKRGQAMQGAADASQGAMVSILGLDEKKVNELCAEAAQGQLLVPVNFNCPGQIVISGHKQACQRAADLAEKFGAIKAVILAVAGAFHTEMMAPAAEALAEAIEKTHFCEPGQISIIANFNARYYNNSDEIKKGLVKQLTSPVLWQSSMEKLLAESVTNFFEIGPGRVLTGLMRKIDRKTKVENISDVHAVKKVLAS